MKSVLQRALEIAAQLEEEHVFDDCPSCSGRVFRLTPAGPVCATCEPAPLPPGVPDGPICIKCFRQVPPDDLFCESCFSSRRRTA